MGKRETRILKSYAEYKIGKLMENPLINEKIRDEIVMLINLTVGEFEYNYITLDEAIDKIANAENLIKEA